jgi:glycosyltransferase involved in cell wall biosynthesis
MRARRLLLANAHGADEFAGGAEGYVARLADGFAARGAEIEILAAFPAEPRGRRVTTLHDRHWRTSRVRWLMNHAGSVVSAPTRRVDDILARVAPDIVHTSNLPGIWTGIWEAARRRRIGVVHTILDYQLLCPRVTLIQPDGSPCRPHPLLCGLRTRRLARWAGAVSHVIGVSQHVLERHREFFPAAKLQRIGLLAFLPERSLAPPGSRLGTLGYIGALEHTKGIRPLLEAAPALARAGCTLLVAGNGRLRGEVEAAAEREPNVLYEGPVAGSAKDSFFERSDAGILPSVWEEPGGPTMVALEWLDAGRPLLVSPRGGMAEVASEVDGAIPVEPTAAAIVRAVERLATPDEWRKAVSRVRPPSGETDLEAWLDAHERVYDEALEARR